jgi:hypothetical protein
MHNRGQGAHAFFLHAPSSSSNMMADTANGAAQSADLTNLQDTGGSKEVEVPEEARLAQA